MIAKYTSSLAPQSDRKPRKLVARDPSTSFATRIALVTASAYVLIAMSAPQYQQPLIATLLMLIGPLAALLIASAGQTLLHQENQPVSLRNAWISGIAGGALGFGITHLLGGTEIAISLQAVGIAGGTASIIGSRHGLKAATVTALIAGLCASAGATMLPQMLEHGTLGSWIVCITGSAAATYWLGIGIAKYTVPAAVLELAAPDSSAAQMLEVMPRTAIIEDFDHTTLTASSPGHDLTAKQLEVLSLLVKGYTDKQMAKKIGISVPGVRNRLETCKDKLSVDSRCALIAEATKLHLE